MLDLAVAAALAVQQSTADDCAVLEAALAGSDLAREAELGSEIRIWDRPGGPESDTEFRWTCDNALGADWESESAALYQGERRSLVLDAGRPDIDGDAARMSLSQYHWAPAEQMGWAYVFDIRLAREGEAWTVVEAEIVSFVD